MQIPPGNAPRLCKKDAVGDIPLAPRARQVELARGWALHCVPVSPQPRAISTVRADTSHPASATARAGKQRKRKTTRKPPPAINSKAGPQAKALAGKRSQSYISGDNGDKAPGQKEPMSPRLGLCPPCPQRRPPVMRCTGAALHPQGTARGHRVAITTTTSIHRPPRGDRPALPARTGTKPGAKPVREGSTALPKQQRLPACLSANPDNKDDG